MVIRHNVGQIVKPKRKVLKVVLFSLLAIVLGVGIWISVSAYRALNKVTALSDGKGSLFSFLSTSQPTLKGQSEGRTNLLILGMGGVGHPGGTLSDTMIVLSIEWKTKKVAMISVPRDLWVNVPGYGSAKLNEAYYYGEKNSKTTGGGGKVSSDLIGNILGVPIHYFVTVDFNGFKKMIDTVGGIDVVVDKDLYDPLYPADNMIDYSPFKITAGQHHLDGATALKYSRSRETTSDFDRSKRQQKVIAALKQKMLTANTLANPKKVTDLLGILGNHVTTNMSVNDIKGFWDSVKDLDLSNIINKVLDTSAGSPLVSGTSSGGSYIILPKKGANNYSDLQLIAKNIFNEVAASLKVEVLNGSGKVGEGTAVSDNLEKNGYNVTNVSNTTKTTVTSVYNCSGASATDTAAKIATLVSGTVQTKTSCNNVDIQVIVGQDALTR